MPPRQAVASVLRRGGAVSPGTFRLAPVSGAPRPLYRAELFLRFAGDAAADRIRPLAEGVRFEGRFQNLVFDALEPYDTAAAAELQGTAAGVEIGLEAALPLRRVTLTAAPPAGTRLELLRPGDEEPSVDVAVSGTSAAIPAGFAESAFIARLSNGAALLAEDVQSLVVEHPAPGALDELGQDALVELDVPRSIATIDLSGDAPDRIGLHRLDGDAVSEEATTQLTRNAGGFLAGELGAIEAAIDIAATGGGFALRGQRAAAGGAVASERLAVVPAGGGGHAPARPFTERRFVLRGDPGRVERSHVRGVSVRGRPTGARLGLAEPGAADSAVFFWNVPGELGIDAPLDAGRFDAGEALAAELDRRLAELEPAGGEAELSVVIESDAPCGFRLDRIELPYRFELTAFAGGLRDKQVLRFAGSEVARRELAVELPAAVTVHQAELRVSNGLRAEQSVAAAGLGEPFALAAAPDGLLLDPERWLGQPLALESALAPTGISLPLLGLVAGSEVRFELQPDVDGAPSGRSLAAGSLALAESGSPGWRTLRFAERVDLAAGPHWLLLRPASGRAVWLAEPAAGSRLTLFDRESPTDHWRPRTSGPRDLAGRYRFLTSGGGPGALPFELATGGQPTGPAAVEADVARFDLSAGLNAALAAGGSGGSVAVPLVFAGTVEGTLTVYPPTLVYA